MKESSGALMFEPGATGEVWIAGPPQALPADVLIDDGWGIAAGEGDAVRLFDFEWDEGVLIEGDVRQLLGQFARIEGVVTGERRGDYGDMTLVEADLVDASTARWVGRRVSVVHRGRSEFRLEVAEEAIVDTRFGRFVALSLGEVQLVASQLASALAWGKRLHGAFDRAAIEERVGIVTARAVLAQRGE